MMFCNNVMMILIAVMKFIVPEDVPWGAELELV